MSKKVILVIIVIILLVGIGFLLISKEGKSKISKQILGELKDNKIISSNNENIANAKMVYIEPGKISNFDKGYYYISDGDDRNNIKYFDYSAKKEIYLCNKPNCNHDTEECSSYLDMSETNELFVYNNYLYLISGTGSVVTISATIGEDGVSPAEVGGRTPIIYRMNLDGTNKTKLFECPTGVELTSSFIFEGNNLYTFFLKSKTIENAKSSYTSMETGRQLVKINLETKKYEEIFDSKNRSIIRNIQWKDSLGRNCI